MEHKREHDGDQNHYRNPHLKFLVIRLVSEFIGFVEQRKVDLAKNHTEVEAI